MVLGLAGLAGEVLLGDRGPEAGVRLDPDGGIFPVVALVDLVDHAERPIVVFDPVEDILPGLHDLGGGSVWDEPGRRYRQGEAVPSRSLAGFDHAEEIPVPHPVEFIHDAEVQGESVEAVRVTGEGFITPSRGPRIS